MPADTALIAETMYVTHHRWLFARLRSKLGCSDDAADIVQHTFLQVLTSSELNSVKEPRAYLTTIAQNLLANHFRRRAIERAYLDALATLPEAVAPSPEIRMLALETLLEIDRLLSGVALQARQAFLMAQIDGMTHAEIAAALGISVPTVKRRILVAAQRCYFSGLLD
ncbi:sigma-70 family RNA polymerase sigma factor [Kerstersia sp.]|uniref:sigma-70 family RNA polymerase sigma factor n=1 Tax=Kerstersia sp. TaxID=1930783 RepID=UPI003F8DA274